MTDNITISTEALINSPSSPFVVIQKNVKKYNYKFISLLNVIFIISSPIILVFEWNNYCNVDFKPTIIVIMATCILQLSCNIYKYWRNINDGNKNQYPYYRFVRFVVHAMILYDIIMCIYIQVKSNQCYNNAPLQYLLTSMFLLMIMIAILLYIVYYVCFLLYVYCCRNNSQDIYNVAEHQKDVINNDQEKCSMCNKVYNYGQGIVFMNDCKHHYHRLCFEMNDGISCPVCKNPSFFGYAYK